MPFPYLFPRRRDEKANNREESARAKREFKDAEPREHDINPDVDLLDRIQKS
jgi:hypothetical protein